MVVKLPRASAQVVTTVWLGRGDHGDESVTVHGESVIKARLVRLEADKKRWWCAPRGVHRRSCWRRIVPAAQSLHHLGRRGMVRAGLGMRRVCKAAARVEFRSSSWSRPAQADSSRKRGVSSETVQV